MEKINVSVADAKKQFSEYVSRSAFTDCRIIINKGNRPLAAIVGMKDLQNLEQSDKRRGLLATIQKWDNFDELQDDIAEAVEKRHTEWAGRDVSF